MSQFNDDQIADEKSISNMKLKYATLNPYQRVRMLQEEVVQDNAAKAGQALQDANKYLQFLQEQTSGENNAYVGELRRINNLELDELKDNFESLKDLEKANPRLICRPYNTYLLNRELSRNELTILNELFTLYVQETRPETKKILERIIRRRLEFLGTLFLRPSTNRNLF